MRKNFQFVTALFLALTLIILTAAPAFAAGPRYLTLVDIQHWSGKGLVLKFEIVNGEYTRQELKGSYALVGNNEFGIDCNIDDNGKVVCVIGDAIAQFTGRTATVVIDGQGFYITVPERKDAKYCYNIYGLMTDDFEGFVDAMEGVLPEAPAATAPAAIVESPDPFDIIFFYWYPATVGRECSATPPTVGDILNFDHPYENELRDLFGEEFFENSIFGEGDMTTAIFTNELFWEGAPEEFACMYQETPAYYAWIYLILGIIYCGGPTPT
ncbi:MAG: hypothetical protein L6461_13735 [Anaerolineae bacterium]|nr:hypothetical protein [Anaerolineae bacterium]